MQGSTAAGSSTPPPTSDVSLPSSVWTQPTQDDAFAWEENSDDIESLGSLGGRPSARNRAASLDGRDAASDLLGSTEVEPYPAFLVNSVPDGLEHHAALPVKLQPVTHGRPPGCAPDAIKLFVGNIPKSCTESQLLPFFETIGKVVDLVVVRDRVTRESKGSAFVWYATRSNAEQAILQLNMRYILPDPTGKQTRPLAIRKAQATVKIGAGGGSGGGGMPGTRVQGSGPGAGVRAGGNSGSDLRGGLGGVGVRSNLGHALGDPLLSAGFGASAGLRLGQGGGSVGGGGGMGQHDLPSLLWSSSGGRSEAFSPAHAAQAASRVAGLADAAFNSNPGMNSNGMPQLSAGRGMSGLGSTLEPLPNPTLHQQHLNLGSLGGGGSMDGMQQMSLSGDVGTGSSMSLSSLMQALSYAGGLDRSGSAQHLVPPTIPPGSGLAPGSNLGSNLNSNLASGLPQGLQAMRGHGSSNHLPAELFGGMGGVGGGGSNGGPVQGMGSVGGGGGGGGGSADWPGFPTGSPASGNLLPETVEPLAITLHLTRQQLLAVTDHLHSVRSLSGAQLMVAPAAMPGVFELAVRGQQHQVNTARVMLHGVVAHA